MSTVQKLTPSLRMRAVVSRVFVVAGAMYDGDSGDSNVDHIVHTYEP